MQDAGVLVFQCPHCATDIIVYESDIACAIFRHAVLKETMQQINPHAAKNECDLLVEQDKVYGCAKPFRVIKRGDIYDVEICDYI